MKRCPRCGREIEEDSVYCPYCGTRLAEARERKRFAPASLAIVIVAFMLIILVTFYLVPLLTPTSIHIEITPHAESGQGVSPSQSQAEIRPVDRRVEELKDKVDPYDPQVRAAAVKALREAGSILIVEEDYYVQPLSYSTVKLCLPPRTRVRGYVSVAEHDINVFFVDKENYWRYIRGESFYYYVGGSGERVSKLRMEVTVSRSGTYYLILDNRYSLITPKRVYVKLVAELDINDPVIKTWILGYWIQESIRYVSDPRGVEYIATPRETLELMAGDCDDVAVLLASMYESVGLDAAIALVDTDGDEDPDHAAVMVYYDGSPDEILDILEDLARLKGLQLSEVGIKYCQARSALSSKYLLGVWVVVDPLMSIRGMPTLIRYKPYSVVKLVDVGS